MNSQTPKLVMLRGSATPSTVSRCGELAQQCLGCGVFRFDTDNDDQFDQLVASKHSERQVNMALTPSSPPRTVKGSTWSWATRRRRLHSARTPEVGANRLYPPCNILCGTEPPWATWHESIRGQNQDVVATGFRNQCDAALNREGRCSPTTPIWSGI